LAGSFICIGSVADAAALLRVAGVLLALQWIGHPLDITGI